MDAPESFDSDFQAFKEVGAVLALGRTERGLSIQQCAKETRIQQSYLIALEAGNKSVLPENVYIKSFIRIYASFLNLDANELLRRCAFELENVNNTKKSPVVLQQLDKNSVANKVIRKLSTFSAILVAAVVIYAYFSKKTDESLLSSFQSQELMEATFFKESVPVVPFEQKMSVDQAGTAQIPSQSALSCAVSEEPKNASQENVNNQDLLASPIKEEASQNIPQDVLLIALTACWVELSDEEGHVLFQKVLKPSEILKLTQQTGYITLGNAGGVKVQGGPLGADTPLGASGQVIKKMDLKNFF
ncbi:MAG TPA: RodZ domain-containing protein [Alphaproteobacteria bacterium]|nr:RodZ domain-containing protein [Alphaproteobacteria bacterium]